VDKRLILEILDCLPKERTVFRYFKGRYALMLLKNVIGKGEKVNQLRKTPYANLLEKPEVRQVLAQVGQGLVTREHLDSVWSTNTLHFILTVDIWGGSSYRYNQTSRRGYNLVLQLNFSNQHDGAYRRMVKPKYHQMLNHDTHPVLRTGARPYFRETLAWSRIDVDFPANSALIEEVQCDWLRRAKFLLSHARRRKMTNQETVLWRESRGKVNDVIAYCEEILLPYQQIWDEALLTATIEFIKTELSIHQIFYHTHTTGHVVKNIKGDKPPVSLYDKLPRKFCFIRQDQAPAFLYQDKSFRRAYKQIQKPTWYYLAV
jgi:hypothetical protein